ncbi:MAG: YlxR family protein [Clostridia bacterium]|nr:YlxR family protein [Clostridia bacterium]
MAEKNIPIRTCISCRNEFPKKELIRIVRSKDGNFTIDKTGKANGRGAYICGKPDCMKKLKKAKMLDRAFGEAVPQEIYLTLEEDLLGKQE